MNLYTLKNEAKCEKCLRKRKSSNLGKTQTLLNVWPNWSVDDNERAGRSSTGISPEHLIAIRNAVVTDRKTSKTSVVLSYGTSKQILLKKSNIKMIGAKVRTANAKRRTEQRNVA